MSRGVEMKGRGGTSLERERGLQKWNKVDQVEQVGEVEEVKRNGNQLKRGKMETHTLDDNFYLKLDVSIYQ